MGCARCVRKCIRTVATVATVCVSPQAKQTTACVLAGIFPVWCTATAQAIGAQNRMVYLAHGSESAEKLNAILHCFRRDELSRHVTFVHFSARTSGSGIRLN